MPRPPNMPTDKHSAREIMKMFSEMAYATSHKDIFEKAIQILYGEVIQMKHDLSKRMVFYCTLCSKDMNSEIALAQHCQSGSHQKNLDRKCRESREASPRQHVKYHHRDKSHDDPDSLQSMLMTSPVKPVGLQMVEEYVKVPGHKRYYKCNLCGAHGKLESIYKHLIGSRHTEKYIKLHVVLKNSILTAKEREFIRESLIKKEGIPVSAIKTYKEKWLYPLKWERCNPSGSSSKKRLEAQRASAGTSQSPFSSKPSSTSSPDRSSKSPLSMFRNQSPPRDNEMNTDDGQQAAAVGPPETREVVMMQDQYTQNYDLEELMIQFNFIVKTSNSPEFDIRNQEDAKAALDMMFKISSALHFITKNKIESAGDKSQPSKEDLIHKKNLLTKIMGNIKLRMEPALLGKHGSENVSCAVGRP